MRRLLASIPALLWSGVAFAGSSGGNGSGGVIDLPEPATIGLLAVGVAAVLRFRKRR